MSQPTWTPREAGSATWIRWPVHANELTPNNPDKWWFKRDSLFLNHDKLGRNFGCKCNQPANNKAEDNNNRPIAPWYNSWFVLKPIVYHHWYTPENAILTGYVLPLLNALIADSYIYSQNSAQVYHGSKIMNLA